MALRHTGSPWTSPAVGSVTYRSRVVTPMRAKIMKITYTDSRDGMVLIGFTDERGEHEIALDTIETADLIGALRTSLEEAVGSPAANSMGLSGQSDNGQ